MAFNSFKIDSPFAQIEGNSVLCKLCNSHVKSAKVWTAHVNGKQHRQVGTFSVFLLKIIINVP